MEDIERRLKFLEATLLSKTTKNAIFDSLHPNFKNMPTVDGDSLITENEVNSLLEGISTGTSWNLTGNNDTVSGNIGSNTPGTNFIGTNDAQNLEVRLNNSSTNFYRFTQNGTLEFINPNRNIFIGLGTGNGNFGTDNICVGDGSLPVNISGVSNTALGSSTLSLNDVGSQNCAVGQSALLFNRSGNNNVAMGYFSLRSNQNSDSTAIGANSLQLNFMGEKNTAVGSQSLVINSSGLNNTAIGYESMSNDISGNENTAVGSNTLQTNSSGTNITCVGYGSDVSMDGLTNSSSFGNGAIVTGSNQVMIGNSDVTTIGGYANWSNLSDGRYKVNIQENVKGLEFINKLRPVTYQINKDKLDENIKTGLIAQEVEVVANEINYIFDGVIKPQNETDHYKISYSTFIAPLIKAIQEQQLMIESLREEIKILKSK